MVWSVGFDIFFSCGCVIINYNNENFRIYDLAALRAHDMQSNGHCRKILIIFHFRKYTCARSCGVGVLKGNSEVHVRNLLESAREIAFA